MISKFSVKKPYTVLVGVVLAIVLGVVSFSRMTTDLLPSISLPYVLIMTTYPGANPETVEASVTVPIEESMATVSNIEGISSVSGENYSMVILEFAQSTNMDSVSLEIREKLDQITSFWDDSIGSPIIIKMNPDMLPVMIAAVGVEGMDNAQISTFVQDSIMPELESIEGVASVSATGLLEERVNVIIRQDKIDALNEKVYAAIDEKMKDAEQELADGRKELEDGKKELSDSEKELVNGEKELADGQKELDDGKSELENGKKELEDKQNAMTAQLAQQKVQLLAAKNQLEEMKSKLDTARTQKEAIDSVDTYLAQVRPVHESLQTGMAADPSLLSHLTNLKTDANVTAYQGYVEAWSNAMAALAQDPADAAALAAKADAETGIDTLRATVMHTDNSTAYSVITAVAGAANPSAAAAAGALAGNDPWYPTGALLSDPTQWQSFFTTIATGLGTVSATSDQLLTAETTYNQLTAQRANLEAALNATTGGADYNTYVTMVNQGLASQGITDLDKAIADLNAGLIALEQGEMTAAIEFANGKATISLGEYQLEVAQAQLDNAKEQLDSGLEQVQDAWKQLEDGQKQLEDGEKELADAKESAYDQADMNGILTVDTVKSLLTAQNFSMPAGYVTEEGIQYLVRVGDKPETIEELQQLPLMDLHMDGVPMITLGDVADVFYTDNSDAIYTNVNGSAGIMLQVQKQTGYSTGQVSDLLDDKFAKLMEENEGLSIITLMDQGIYIDLVMDSIINNILFGGILAILILILFLKDLRPTLVIACSIPISLVTAVVCMYFSGVTLNVISLSGLALGIGMLVDNSIVVIENIYRMRAEGASMQKAAVEGAKEVAGAITASTLTTVCVFLPIVFTEGITRQLFVDMGLTIAYSLFASLIIALTVVPAMASKVLTGTRDQKDSKFFNALTKGYEKVLRVALKGKPLVFLLVIALLIVSALAAVSNGTAFMSDMESTQLTVNVQLPEDTPLAETAEVTDAVVERIRTFEDVTDVGAMTSSSGSMSAMLGADSGSTNATTIYVVTREKKTMSSDELADAILEKTADLNAEITIDTSSMDMSALGGSGITIQVRGRDIDTLQRIADEVAAILESVEGTENVSNGLEETEEELRILIDREKAVNYGLTVAQVFQQVYGKLADATSATTLVAADKDYSVYVMHGTDIALTRELVKEIEVTGTDEDGENVKIPLSEIARFETADSLTSINRADQTRYVSVSASIADGYNVGLVARDVEEAMKDYEVPTGYRLVYSGENETINDAMSQMVLMLLLALVFMYLIMVAQFQSLLSPFIIMFTIPLAFTGGLFGLFVTGSEVSVIAMIGFVMLAGIIVNNGIVLIDYINQLVEGGMDRKEAILTAGRTRLRPVLMTALTTILALSTMVFSQDMGAEMSRPMAIVTIGGLLYGTLLTLIVIPCVYDVFARFSSGRRKKMQDVGMDED